MELRRRRIVLRTLGGALATGVAGCLTVEPDDDGEQRGDAAVPMARYDAGNTGKLPDATGPTGSLAAEWTFDVEYERAMMASQPAVVDGEVYTGVVNFGEGTAALLSIDATDGTERWRFETRGDVLATPAAGAESVYAVVEGALRAFDRSSGDESWTYSLPVGGGDPTLVDDTVYVVGGEPAVHAVDAETGEARWTTSGEDQQWGRTAAVADGRVFVTAIDGGAVVALDGRANGAELWRVPVEEPTDAPVATGEAVFVVDDGGTLHRISADGALQWTESVAESSFGSHTAVVAPALAEDALYCCGQGGELVAVGVDGERRWHVDLSYGPESAPVVADGVVYVAGAATADIHDVESDTGVVYGVSTDGEVVLEHTDAAVFWPPAVLDDTAYLGVARTEEENVLDVTALR